jgi:hypothetical protein
VVLAISSDDVGILTYGSDNGKLWFALRPPNAIAPNSSGTTVNTILQGIRLAIPAFPLGMGAQLQVTAPPGLAQGAP